VAAFVGDESPQLGHPGGFSFLFELQRMVTAGCGPPVSAFFLQLEGLISQPLAVGPRRQGVDPQKSG